MGQTLDGAEGLTHRRSGHDCVGLRLIAPRGNLADVAIIGHATCDALAHYGGVLFENARLRLGQGA